MSARLSQSFKSYQVELYDTIKSGSHIICLGPEQTKTYLFLFIIKSRAHELHPKFKKKSKQVVTLIFEPNEEIAQSRYKLLANHTELSIVNLFIPSEKLLPHHQIAICPIEYFEFNKPDVVLDTIVFDKADTILRNNGFEKILKIVEQSNSTHILALMCSLIDDSKEILPDRTIILIEKLEALFKARCETLSDLRSLSRQTVASNFETIECNQSELIFCDQLLLVDELLRNFCHFVSDSRLDSSGSNYIGNSQIEPEPGNVEGRSHNISSKYPTLCNQKQLLLVQSCLSDVIYAAHYLGLWCAKKTIQLHLTEFARILSLNTNNEIISAAVSTLNCVFGRFEDLIDYYPTLKLHNQDPKQIPHLIGLSAQSTGLLDLLSNHDHTKSCVIHVKRPVIAKVMALWLDKLSTKLEQFSFIKANYIVGSSKKYRSKTSADSFDLHHEAAIREFRFGNCNVLVTATNQKGIDVPRCNLVVSFDLPTSFADFIYTKATCRTDLSKYVLIVDTTLEKNAKQKLLNFFNMEKLLSNISMNRMLIEADAEEVKQIEHLEEKYPPYLSTSKTPATLWRAIGIVNKYCTKLPSDSFTKLSPEWIFKKCEKSDKYYCEVRLPINSPVRQTIVGPPSKIKSIAQRLAAYTVCKVLHETKELDDNMLPITKESMKPFSPFLSREPNVKGCNQGGGRSGFNSGRKSQTVGSTRHRQYYEKRIASIFSGPLPQPGIRVYLYKFNMILICPIPDEQNRRGRRIVDPKETNRNYAIVCSQKLPKICPFPLFTRSGEVRIFLELVDENLNLNQSQVDNLKLFHEFTFSKVLRLEKYPIKFDPSKSPFAVLLAPVIEEENDSTHIDWKFVDKIVKSDKCATIPSIEDCRKFKFIYDDYADAVVIPWYRITDCQEFAYYVAHICTDLTPKSAFPDKYTGYPSFIDYYKGKYSITVYHEDQPILDVDHTSARLNLLTPRYVNRKGITLPSSTAKTRRESRESLAQKQLLIPELCSIHPFPASFWRKAVCLPCIFHRLNSLFLAEELRRTVAASTGVGFVEPPEKFDWEPLDFGWSLRDVIQQHQNQQQLQEQEKPQDREHEHKDEQERKTKKQDNEVVKPEILDKKHAYSNTNVDKKTAPDSCREKVKKQPSPTPSHQRQAPAPAPAPASQEDGSTDFVIDHFDPSKLFIPDIPLNEMASDWMNITLISSTVPMGGDSTTSNSGGSRGQSKNVPSGWDQPLEQQDILIEHIDEPTWSDCEMEFEGEMTEKVGKVVRCGSPSTFEAKLSRGKHCNRKMRKLVPNGEGGGVGIPKYKEAYGIDDLAYEKNTGGAVELSSVCMDNNELDYSDDFMEEEFDSVYFKWPKGDPKTGGADSDGDEDTENEKPCRAEPLIRELFVPSHKVSCGMLRAGSIDELVDIFAEFEPSDEHIASTDFEKIGQLEPVQCFGKDEPLHYLLHFVQQYNQDMNQVTETSDSIGQLASNADFVRDTCKLWFDTMMTLDARLKRALQANPNIFDNVTTVEIKTGGRNNGNSGDFVVDNYHHLDDKKKLLKLEKMNPTFGELLPDRDSLSLADDVNNAIATGDSTNTVGKANGTKNGSAKNSNESMSSSSSWKNIKFDPTMKELETIGPSPSIILHALTMSNASDGINLERLETVGDSFLKYSITAYLYCIHPTLHEGKLSYLRSMEISNKNLYDLGRSKNLGELMSATKFEPNDNWLAPGYFVDRSDRSSVNGENSIHSTSIARGVDININEAYSKKREIDKALAEVPYDLLLQHSIPDKSIADCVEALIGAYLTASGSRAALLFMQWLGLKVIPAGIKLATKPPSDQLEASKMWRWLEAPPSPLISLPPAGATPDTSLPTTTAAATTEESTKSNELLDVKANALCELDRHFYGGQLDEFERLIGYRFVDKAYLVQAFSHNSYYENHVTNCHQRLEFLGDALLDYLITRYLFEDPRCHSPGTLTDLRSALVNNTFFASLAVKYNFHKFLKYISDDLFLVIDGFVRKFQSDSEMTTKGYTLLITEGESEYAEDIEVPKALGDVFESVAGAIYLDSGMSLDKVWQVYFRMMKPEIEYFSSHVPKSPIRELLESMPQNVRFSPSELAPDRKHRVIAEVFGLGKFIGVGRNKHSAKCTAAKRALRALKSTCVASSLSSSSSYTRRSSMCLKNGREAGVSVSVAFNQRLPSAVVCGKSGDVVGEKAQMKSITNLTSEEYDDDNDDDDDDNDDDEDEEYDDNCDDFD